MKYHFQPSPKKKTKLLTSLFSTRHFRLDSKWDRGLLLCVFGLLVFGCVMVYSASALMAEVRFHDQYFFLKRQILWSLVGSIVCVWTANISLRSWQSMVKGLYVITVLFLVLVLGVGPEIAGARRWLRFGPLGFQPSELSKLTMILLVADYMDRRQSRLSDFIRGLLPILFSVAVLFILILVEPDLGTPALMGAVFLALMILGGVRWKHMFFLLSANLSILIFAIGMVRYRLDRVFSYLNPWDDPHGRGYQLVQSLLAMGSGGLFGRGLGNSQIKISSLPDAHTDFIFSILGEELGLLGTLLCAGLFLFICLRGLIIAKGAGTGFGKLVAAGISLTIGLQALVNMGVASGLFPTKGMPLPFLSFGGSSLVTMLVSVGILIHISRARNLHSGRVND